MRGISFSATRRSRASDRSSNPQTPSPTTSSSTSSTSIGLFKRLSTHFRRDQLAAHHLPALGAVNHVSRRVSTDLAAVGYDTKRKGGYERGKIEEVSGGGGGALAGVRGVAGRALTFTAGEGAGGKGGGEGIPFFGRGEKGEVGNASGAAGVVAEVRGKPEWMKKADENLSREEGEKATLQVVGEGVGRERGKVLGEVNASTVVGSAGGGHALSFNAGEGVGGKRKAEGVIGGGGGRAKSMNVGMEVVGGVRRRRWELPEKEKRGTPKLFTPIGTFERISGRRDRTEARVLGSACTFLEVEIERMKACLETESGIKELRGCLEGRVERLEGVMGILEERYECIEQLYVKSEEYAVAMGRFFEVSPKVINRLAAGERDLVGGEKYKVMR